MSAARGPGRSGARRPRAPGTAPGPSRGGGRGRDEFRFAEGDGRDIVFDFGKADAIRLPSGAGSFADLQIRGRGGDALVRYGDGDVIRLDGVNAASLRPDDFEFGLG